MVPTIAHASFIFTLPVGATLVPFQNHTELRFMRKDGKDIEKWFEETYARFKAEIGGLSHEMTVEGCPDCNGAGRGTDGKICLSCSGSGRKGFVAPGKHVAPVEKPADATASAMALNFSPEIIEEARRLVEARNQDALKRAKEEGHRLVQQRLQAEQDETR